jgi:hypothetical protein
MLMYGIRADTNGEGQPDCGAFKPSLRLLWGCCATLGILAIAQRGMCCVAWHVYYVVAAAARHLAQSEENTQPVLDTVSELSTASPDKYRGCGTR